MMNHILSSRHSFCPRKNYFTLACALPTFAFASKARQGDDVRLLCRPTQPPRGTPRAFRIGDAITGKIVFHGPPST